MDDFSAKAKDAVAAAGKYGAYSARLAVEYIELIETADRKDAAALLSVYGHARQSGWQGFPDWRCEPTGKLLRNMTTETRAAAAKAVAAGDGDAYREWATLFAAQKADDTVDLVRSWVRRQESQHAAVTLGDLEPLGVLGTDGAYALLQEYAAAPDRFFQEAAKGVLAMYPQVTSAPQK